MILIYPPVAKPSEPPPGIARLQGALSRNGVGCTVLDANLEGLFSLLDAPAWAPGRWTRRAAQNVCANLSALRNPSGYGNFDRYKRSVMDLNRLLEVASGPARVRLSLANYRDSELSPVRSGDLLRAAETPAENPFHPYFSRRLRDLLEEKSPSVVGFSLNYLSQALCTFAMAGYLRRAFPSLKLALGGGLVTSWMRGSGWNNPFGGLFDLVTAGPGEDSLLSLGGAGSPRVERCLPEYGSLSDGYLAPGFILPYSASSGCWWNRCAFCPERAEGNPYVPVPARRAVEEIRALVEATRPVLLHLLDNAVSPALLRAIAKNPPGAPWYGFVRVARSLADLDFCLAMKRSGCVMLKLGLESGDQGVIDSEGKGIDLRVASLALNTLKKAGIATYAYLLFGTPSETLTEARKTLEFTVKHGEAIDFLNLAIFNMPVRGPESRGLEPKSHYEGDLSLYTGFSHPRGWDRGLVRQFLDKEFRRHPAIAAILRRDPPFFTSNHAPFFAQSTSCGDNSSGIGAPVIRRPGTA